MPDDKNFHETANMAVEMKKMRLAQETANWLKALDYASKRVGNPWDKTYLYANIGLITFLATCFTFLFAGFAPALAAFVFAFLFIGVIKSFEVILERLCEGIFKPIKDAIVNQEQIVFARDYVNKGWNFIVTTPLTKIKEKAKTIKWLDPWFKDNEKEECTANEHPYRMLATSLVLFIVIAIIIFAVSKIVPDLINNSLDNLKQNLDALEARLVELNNKAGGSLFDPAEIKATVYTYLYDGGGLLGKMVGFLATQLGNAMHAVEFMLLTPLYMFAMIMNWEKVVAIIKKVLNNVCTPDGYEDKVDKFSADIGGALKNFAQGKMIVMGIMMAYYSLSYSVVAAMVLPYDIPLGVLLGLVTGFLCVMPVVGMVAGIIIMTLYTFSIVPEVIASGGAIVSFILFALSVGGIGYVLEGKFLDTYFIGKKLEVHGFLVIFAIVLGGNLAGLFGMLIATPTLAIMTVIVPLAFNGFVEHFKPENRQKREASHWQAVEELAAEVCRGAPEKG